MSSNKILVDTKYLNRYKQTTQDKENLQKHIDFSGKRSPTKEKCREYLEFKGV